MILKKVERTPVEEEWTIPSIFRTLAVNLNEGLGIIDGNHNILFANDRLSDLTGFSQEDLIQMNLAEILIEVDPGRLKESLDGWKKGIGSKLETVLRNQDKNINFVLISVSPWRDEEGRFRGYFALFTDISKYRNTEEALKESEEKYRATVEQSADNIYIYDIKSEEIVESNQALQQLLGYSADDLKGMKAKDFVAHTEIDISNRISEVLNKGQAIIGERTYKRKDGSLVDVEVSASRITMGEKKMLCVVSRDITERKNYQRSLIEERNRAEFYMDLLAHDMGNILHGIKNGLDTLELVREDRKRKNNTMEIVHSLANRSMKLAKDIIKLSKIKEDPVEPREILIQEMIENAVDMALDGFPDSKPEIRLNIDEGMTVFAEDVLTEAFYNLIHNAVKAQTGDKIILGVDAFMTDSTARIEIWDHGGGLSDEWKEIIFDRYYNPVNRKHSGLGMTIVKLVIGRYGGEISIKDRMESGKIVGSNFIIDLPVGR
jgi:PAS domain S-box-containing protein